MEIKSFIILIVGILNVLLGYFILKKNCHNSSNIWYFFLCLFGGLWGLMKSFQIFVIDVDLQGELIIKLIYAFGILAPLAYFMFAYNFPYKLKEYSKFTFLVIFFIPVIIILLLLTGLLKMEELTLTNGVLNRNILQLGFSIFAFYFFTYVFMGFITLLRKYFKDQGVYKKQILFLIIATITTFITTGIVSVIFLLFNNVKYDWLGAIFLLIHFSITWYYIFYKQPKTI